VKTLGEIAIDAGLVDKATAAKAGRMAEGRKEPLVVVLVHELGVNEVALVAALRKQTRVPLIDPAEIEIGTELTVDFHPIADGWLLPVFRVAAPAAKEQPA